MSNNKKTKRALALSLLSLILCASMLLGSTIAWFTDKASTGVNIITSGNLDINFYYSADEMATWQDAEKVENVFTADKWEPGYTQVGYFMVENAGSLALDFKVATNVVKETAGINKNGDEFKLSDYLLFGFVDTEEAFADRASARDAVATSNKFSNVGTNETRLEAGESATFAIVVWMPEATGDVANHNGINKPEIQFGINVIASQADVEADSFDEKYDTNAAFPSAPKLDAIVAEPKTAEDFANILKTAFTGGSATGTITINLTDDFDFANAWTTINGANYSGSNTVVINGNGHSIKNMNQPLIEGVFGGAGALTFKNLTIKDSVISAAGGSGVGIGVFMNNADASASVTFENCSIENVKITNTADNSTVGGFVGYSSAKKLTFTNCSVKGSEFVGTKDAGAFVGYTQSAVTATNVTCVNNKITSSNASDYRVGAIAGTFNSLPAIVTIKEASGNEVKQENAKDLTKKVSEYVGRVYTDVTIDGVLLDKNN